MSLPLYTVFIYAFQNAHKRSTVGPTVINPCESSRMGKVRSTIHLQMHQPQLVEHLLGVLARGKNSY